MFTVRLNGSEFTAPVSGLRNIAEVVELIKASIDPDSIIVDLQLNGKALQEPDWQSSLAAHQTSVLEVVTGGKEEFVADRLAKSPEIVDMVLNRFQDARNSFTTGNVSAGNTALGGALRDLRAFLDWYNTVLQMMPAHWQSHKDSFLSQISTLNKTCEEMMQQQLYQSWWAIGETIQNKLAPQLGDLKRLCTRLGE
jgi:hypothetical protein